MQKGRSITAAAFLTSIVVGLNLTLA